MSRGINKAIIIGTLGRDLEVRHTAGGSAVANLRIATNESWKDKQTGGRGGEQAWGSDRPKTAQAGAADFDDDTPW